MWKRSRMCSAWGSWSAITFRYAGSMSEQTYRIEPRWSTRSPVALLADLPAHFIIEKKRRKLLVVRPSLTCKSLRFPASI